MAKILAFVLAFYVLYTLVIILLQVSPWLSLQPEGVAGINSTAETQPVKKLLNTLTIRELVSTSKQRLIILLWTANVDRSTYYAPDSALRQCNVDCEFTTNQSLVDIADAVVLTVKGELPAQKKKNQIRVFLSQEPAALLTQKGHPYFSTPFPNSFNWTMTYRRDSDVIADFGSFIRRAAAVDYSSKISIAFRNPSHLHEYKEKYLKGKTKLLAWIVSNCVTSSRRELYVQKLQNYIPVDIYGACGTLKCKLSREEKNLLGCDGCCYAELSSKYKFLLSFENSLCIDYVTEKLYLALQHNMLPIVYGGANYSQFAPPHSFINALDFPSPSKVADYLRYLDTHEEEYLKYFIWKEHYEIVDPSNHWCRLCQKLWSISVTSNSSGTGTPTIDPTYSKVYENINKWWWFQGENSSMPACLSPPPLWW